MYAYKQQNNGYNGLYVVQERKSAGTYKIKTRRRTVKKKKKKKNPLAGIFRFCAVFTFLGIFAFGIFPHSYNGLVRQVISPYKISVSAHPQNGMVLNTAENRSAVDMYAISNPITNYVNNDMFHNFLLLTPTPEKAHGEISTMYRTDELSGLKLELQTLMSRYPSIYPAVYVWEYENGRYVDINGDKIYSAASIIKLPILVRMFKSIEAKQITIYDDMVLTDYYKSSGSGNLQYARTGRKYTLDELAKTMIQDSDNTSTNMIMSKIGGMNDINTGLRDWGISKTYVRTWLPDLRGTNKTTAEDIAKILYNLDNPGFLNINSREYIIDYLSHVKNNRLIAAGLGDGALFVHKTGDIGTMLGDAGIVYAPNGKKYIVVILAERPNNSPLGKEFIVKASNLIYKYIVG